MVLSRENMEKYSKLENEINRINRKLDYYTEGNMYVNGINNNECDMTFIVENRCEKTIYSRKQYAAFWGSVVLLEMFVVVFLIIKDRRICNSMKGKEYDSV